MTAAGECHDKKYSGLSRFWELERGGDSLIDYNNRRTVLSIGMSLVDW